MTQLPPALVEIPDIPSGVLPREAWQDRLLTQIGSALDSTALQAARLAIDAFLMPRPEELPAMLETAAQFLSGGLRDDPRSYLALAAEAGASGPRTHTQRRRRSLPGGTVYSRRFGIDLQPAANPVAGGKAAKHDQIHIEHWIHHGHQPRPTALALHGFGMGNPRIDAVAIFANEIFRHGCDVALMTLPYHAARKPPGARFSGQHFTSVDIGQLNQAVRRSVYEICAVENWLRVEHSGPVGMIGLSLGGYISALMAGILPQLDFVIPIVPPVCIGDLAWRFLQRSHYHPTGSQAETLLDSLRTAYRVHSPLTYPAVVAKERLLILAGRGDQIVPPEHPYALWLHWNQPDIEWFSGSHLAPFHRRHLAARIVGHIERCVG